MFRLLGKLVARSWPLLLAGWAALLAGLWVGAPSWDRVGKSGQFAYLPADAPTRRAEALFDEAFPGQRAGSGIVLVVARRDGELTPDDLGFIDRVLAARLRQALLPDGPASVAFCHEIDLDYVSCSPFRVPIARLAAAQAALGKVAVGEGG